MDNPEKLATKGIQDENKNTPQYMLDTTIRRQTETTGGNQICLNIKLSLIF